MAIKTIMNMMLLAGFGGIGVALSAAEVAVSGSSSSTSTAILFATKVIGELIKVVEEDIVKTSKEKFLEHLKQTLDDESKTDIQKFQEILDKIMNIYRDPKDITGIELTKKIENYLQTERQRVFNEVKDIMFDIIEEDEAIKSNIEIYFLKDKKRVIEFSDPTFSCFPVRVLDSFEGKLKKTERGDNKFFKIENQDAIDFLKAWIQNAFGGKMSRIDDTTVDRLETATEIKALIKKFAAQTLDGTNIESFAFLCDLSTYFRKQPQIKQILDKISLKTKKTYTQISTLILKEATMDLARSLFTEKEIDKLARNYAKLVANENGWKVTKLSESSTKDDIYREVLEVINPLLENEVTIENIKNSISRNEFIETNFKRTIKNGSVQIKNYLSQISGADDLGEEGVFIHNFILYVENLNKT